MLFHLIKSLRTYRALVQWRKTDSTGSRDLSRPDPCFLYTKTFNHPLDVASNEEPVLNPDQQHWSGSKVVRAPVSSSDSARVLGNLFLLRMVFKMMLHF